MAEALLNNVFRSRIAGYGLAVLGVAVTTAALEPIRLQISVTSVALTLLLVVLFVATGWGSRPAFVASVLGMLCFNYFFLPPVGTWTIADPENWFALTAFLITAVIAGQLSARVKRRAEEAEAGKKEIERLYEELRDAFEKASQAEAFKRSEKLKSALLDAVTHDIRTPLTSIKASVTTLLDEQKDASFNGVQVHLNAETRRDMLEVIDEESDRLNRFVEGLIELAQIEAGEMRLRRQWDAIGEIISAVLSRVEPLVRRHKILIEAEKDLPVIKVDSRAVSEVLYTLIDNAAKYSPDATTIRIVARRFEEANILVAVEDEGQGIPPPLRERVFDKFFRATRESGDNKGKHQPASSGMGLAIAKGIVEAHDGRIWITDASRKNGGAGSRFEFTLPIGDDSETAVEQSAAAANVEKII